MSERFFDPEFTARVVRLLQLKGGRAPSEVADEIVPVLDLSQLFARAATELPHDLVGAIFARAIAGNAFQKYVGPNLDGGAGNVVVGQLFNPLGSARLSIIHLVQAIGLSATRQLVRRHDTALTTLSPIGTAENMKAGGPVPLTVFRYQSFAIAGFPPAGMRAPSAVGSANVFSNVMANGPAVLEPGQGLAIHRYVNPTLTDTELAPENGVLTLHVGFMELPF